LDGDEEDATTDAAVAELVEHGYIEAADPPLRDMNGPSSFRYRL
jgi:hypothetical protein